MVMQSVQGVSGSSCAHTNVGMKDDLSRNDGFFFPRRAFPTSSLISRVSAEELDLEQLISDFKTLSRKHLVSLGANGSWVCGFWGPTWS